MKQQNPQEIWFIFIKSKLQARKMPFMKLWVTEWLCPQCHGYCSFTCLAKHTVRYLKTHPNFFNYYHLFIPNYLVFCTAPVITPNILLFKRFWLQFFWQLGPSSDPRVTSDFSLRHDNFCTKYRVFRADLYSWFEDRQHMIIRIPSNLTTSLTEGTTWEHPVTLYSALLTSPVGFLSATSPV